MNRQTQRFWAKLKTFFARAEEDNYSPATVVHLMIAVATGGSTEELALAGYLPPLRTYTHQWASVRTFLSHPDHQGLNTFMVSQLTLLADGVRDSRLHDNCTILTPLLY